MTESQDDPQAARPEDEKARDSLAGDIAKDLDQDLSQIDEERPDGSDPGA